MKNYLILISMAVFPTVANAQVTMTTDNRSLGPGTYEEMSSGLPPPPDGYKKGWQSSIPTITSGAGGLPITNRNQDVPDE